jgi:hypothetical protein
MRGLARFVAGDIEMASMRRRQIGDFFDARGPFDGWRLRQQSEPTRLNGAAMLVRAVLQTARENMSPDYLTIAPA